MAPAMCKLLHLQLLNPIKMSNPNAIHAYCMKTKEKNAFIVGTEVTGIPKSVLKHCDVIAEIPMLGKKESLNVATSLGISLFRILGI